MPSRRHFIKTAGLVTAGFAGFNKLLAFSSSNILDKNISPGYGDLVPDPNGVIDLPKGFSYRIISKQGDKMSDGFFVPGLADGMAAFPGSSGRTILIRNHELNANSPNSFGPFGNSNELIKKVSINALYDKGFTSPAMGGTTTLVYDTNKKEVVKEYLSLSGTLRNCAGGPTPWNSWLTCEESVHKKDDNFLKDHGYVFEVPASENIKLYDAVPLVDMGRFNHEAVAVDYETGIVYLTEDREDGLLYRFIPETPGKLINGGKLQALTLKDMPSLDTRNKDIVRVNIGDIMEVNWIDLEDIQAPNDDLRLRGYDSGAAMFARGEGMWYGNNSIYFACTSGGKNGKGQIWKIILDKNTKEKLQLFIEPNDSTLVENADNLTVSPWGDLILCEDGSSENYLVGVTPEGNIYKFGKNAMNNSELAGAAFSPDGSTLFFNIQTAGLTIAVTGPWHKKQI